MIRRLAAAIRRLTRRQPTPPSEPHSRCQYNDAVEPPCASLPDICHCVGPDAGVAQTTVRVPAVRDEDQHHAPAADMHRTAPTGGTR